MNHISLQSYTKGWLSDWVILIKFEVNLKKDCIVSKTTIWSIKLFHIELYYKLKSNIIPDREHHSL